MIKFFAFSSTTANLFHWIKFDVWKQVALQSCYSWFSLAWQWHDVWNGPKIEERKKTHTVMNRSYSNDQHYKQINNKVFIENLNWKTTEEHREDTICYLTGWWKRLARFFCSNCTIEVCSWRSALFKGVRWNWKHYKRSNTWKKNYKAKPLKNHKFCTFRICVQCQL